MLISFGLPVSGSWATPETITHVARRADELGYHGVWTFQRLLSPVDNSAGETYRSVHDPLVTLGYAAAVTRRVRLGVAIINVPFVSPILLARQATTVDILSGGRLDLGLGLGWSPDEFEASGVSLRQPGPAIRGVPVRAAYNMDETRLSRTRVSSTASHRREWTWKPVQRPHPPILLGGTAVAALRRVGRLGDGWISSSRADLATIGESIAVVRQAAEQAGRDPSALRFICRGPTLVREEEPADRRRLTGTVDSIRTDLAALAEQGVTEVFLDLNFDPRIGSPTPTRPNPPPRRPRPRVPRPGGPIRPAPAHPERPPLVALGVGASGGRRGGRGRDGGNGGAAADADGHDGGQQAEDAGRDPGRVVVAGEVAHVSRRRWPRSPRRSGGRRRPSRTRWGVGAEVSPTAQGDRRRHGGDPVEAVEDDEDEHAGVRGGRDQSG